MSTRRTGSTRSASELKRMSLATAKSIIVLSTHDGCHSSNVAHRVASAASVSDNPKILNPHCNVTSILPQYSLTLIARLTPIFIYMYPDLNSIFLRSRHDLNSIFLRSRHDLNSIFLRSRHDLNSIFLRPYDLNSIFLHFHHDLTSTFFYLFLSLQAIFSLDLQKCRFFLVCLCYSDC
jgi:hypothetical protein